MTLLEQYKGRLAVSESVFSKAHNGQKMDNYRKLITAKCIDNISKFLSESFDQASGTQRADLGLWKKFCLNLTTVTLPNLIAPELVIVHPMTSMSGFITYLEYTSGVQKGGVAQDQVLNSVFELGEVNEARTNYTGERVVDTYTATADQTAFTLTWDAVITEGKLEGGSVLVAGTPVTDYTAAKDAATGVVTVTLTTGAALGAAVRIGYIYNNVVIPQEKLPTIKATVKSIPLLAHARRIAVYYSQMAAFQAKTDYGFDLGDQLAEQAVGELSFEIDTEVVDLLQENATVSDELTFNKALPYGVSMDQHYQSFAEKIGIAKQKIYDATKKFVPNYMIVSSGVLPILPFLRGWDAANVERINGPYFAGTVDGMKVFVAPGLKVADGALGTVVFGLNGSDMMTSAAVYAPYMPIVPTQLLQYADGGTTQGWSTLYDLKMLNPKLLVAGKVVNDPSAYSIRTESI